MEEDQVQTPVKEKRMEEQDDSEAKKMFFSTKTIQSEVTT